MPKTHIDKLRALVDRDRLSNSAPEWLAELEPVDEWAENLQQLVDARHDCIDALDAWQYAEGRDEKSDTREEALDALGRLVEALDQLDPVWTLVEALDLDVEHERGCTCDPERYDPGNDPSCAVHAKAVTA